MELRNKDAMWWGWRSNEGFILFSLLSLRRILCGKYVYIRTMFMYTHSPISPMMKMWRLSLDLLIHFRRVELQFSKVVGVDILIYNLHLSVIDDAVC